MPYLRGDIYYIDLRPAGYPYRIARSTGQRSKRLAMRMEAAVQELAATGRHGPLDALRQGAISLGDLYAAKVAGKLDEALEERTDPPLRETADEWAKHRSANARSALNHLYQLAPPGARLSWLAEPGNVRDLVQYLRARGLAAATERRYVADYAVLLRDVAGTELPKPELRKPDRHRMRYLDRAEIEQVRDVAGEWWLPIALALATGIRRGELLALRVRDLDLEASHLVVERGKSARSRRRIPLPGPLVAMLRGWIAAQRYAPSDRLFPVSSSTLERYWGEIRAEVGLEDVRWHDLRHTYAVHAAQSGMPLPELQVRLGHQTISMTMRYAAYAPAQDTMHHRRALESMGLAGEQVDEPQRLKALRKGA